MRETSLTKKRCFMIKDRSYCCFKTLLVRVSVILHSRGSFILLEHQTFKVALEKGVIAAHPEVMDRFPILISLGKLSRPKHND